MNLKAPPRINHDNAEEEKPKSGWPRGSTVGTTLHPLCRGFSFGTWPSNPPIQFKSHRIRVHAAPLLVSFRSLGRPVGKICSRFRFVEAAYTCPEIINLQPPPPSFSLCRAPSKSVFFTYGQKKKKKRSVDKLRGVNTKLHSKCTRCSL